MGSFMITRKAFLEDAYLTAFEAEIVALVDGNCIVLNATNFHAEFGGQPGDTGFIELPDGSSINITNTFYSKDKKTILHQTDDDLKPLEIGTSIVCHINWTRRYKLMQMHSACHLLSVVYQYAIISSRFDEDEGVVNFDLQRTTITKQMITDKMMSLVNDNHPIYCVATRKQQTLSKSGQERFLKSKPPYSFADIIQVCIGENALIDIQECYGTHVSETKEIGEIQIDEIENNKYNSFRIRFGRQP